MRDSPRQNLTSLNLPNSSSPVLVTAVTLFAEEMIIGELSCSVKLLMKSAGNRKHNIFVRHPINLRSCCIESS